MWGWRLLLVLGAAAVAVLIFGRGSAEPARTTLPGVGASATNQRAPVVPSEQPAERESEAETDPAAAVPRGALGTERPQDGQGAQTSSPRPVRVPYADSHGRSQSGSPLRPSSP
jgi:hypothetical protein